jgi:hypothetical protein
MKFSEARFRWFRVGITLVLITVCNGLLLGGLWASGLDLDFVMTNSELYDASSGHCVGISLVKVTGVEGPIQVCSEWLDTNDPTGRVHKLRTNEPLAMGEDGNLYYPNARNEDYHLLGLLAFFVVVMASGMGMKRFLLTWYQRRLIAGNR